MGPKSWTLSRDEWVLCSTVIALSGVLNGQLPAPFRIPAGLTASCLVARLATQTRVELKEMGVSGRCLQRGIVMGLAAGIPLSTIIVAGAMLPSTRRFYRAQQITDASLGRALYEAFVRIPAGTALPEEFIFRGALLSVLSRNHSAGFSIAASSLLFGLWHVGPALRQSGAKGFRLESICQRVLHAAASVAATAAAGVALALLRRRSGSVFAPWAVHAAVNGSGYLAGWFAMRSSKDASTKTSYPEHFISQTAASSSR